MRIPRKKKKEIKKKAIKMNKFFKSCIIEKRTVYREFWSRELNGKIHLIKPMKWTGLSSGYCEIKNI